MKCPQCDRRLSVTNSRHSGSAFIPMTRPMRDWVVALVGWYTSDWVVRNRICPLKRGGCGWSGWSVEVLREDAPHLFKGNPDEATIAEGDNKCTQERQP